ncbi:MAG: hypothetical protein VCA36_10550 [Opitutales bacterium]
MKLHRRLRVCLFCGVFPLVAFLLILFLVPGGMIVDYFGPDPLDQKATKTGQRQVASVDEPKNRAEDVDERDLVATNESEPGEAPVEDPLIADSIDEGEEEEPPAEPEGAFPADLRALSNSWVGYTNDGALRYKLTLKRKGDSNDFHAVFTLPNYRRWENYANHQNFKLISIEDGVVTFERNNGHVYRAKLVEKGTKMVEGTRGNKGAGINPNFVNWELLAALE